MRELLYEDVCVGYCLLPFFTAKPQPHCAAHVRSQALRILYESGITAQASSRTARLSWIWERWIYWIPERAFSPSPALSATCLETCLHYWWSPGSHYTLSAIRLPPSGTDRYNTCVCTHMWASSAWTNRLQPCDYKQCYDGSSKSKLSSESWL